MRILNLGSLNIDKVYKVSHFAKAKETILADSCHICPGGKGLNQSVAIARAGGEVFHAGAVGSDGEELLSVLSQENVKLDLIRWTDGVSGSAVIQVCDGENSIVPYAIRAASESCHVPANQVPVVDTTAAGDTFCGYYLACISKSMTVKAALKTATAASGLAVGRSGAASSIPYWAEVRRNSSDEQYAVKK